MVLVIGYLEVVGNMAEKGKSLRSFEDLECWKACRSVRRFITELVKKYPKEEKYALVDDMKRAARSTTHNLAEGFGRFHYPPTQKGPHSCVGMNALRVIRRSSF